MHILKFFPVLAFWAMTMSGHTVSASEVGAGRLDKSAAVEAQIEAALKPKSFREWKNERVLSSKHKLDNLKSKIDMAKSQAKTEAGLGKEMQMDRLMTQLEQAQFSLDMANDLSVTDYFVGYLAKMDDRKSAINAVAGKLTAEEVAELMNAYANSFFGSQGGVQVGGASGGLKVEANNRPSLSSP